MINLHGSHPYRPYDVDLGTVGGKSVLGNDELVTDLTEALKREGLLNISSNYFGASKNQTITKFAAGLAVPALQLEISSTWLQPSQSDLFTHRYAQLLQATVRYVQAEIRDVKVVAPD